MNPFYLSGVLVILAALVALFGYISNRFVEIDKPVAEQMSPQEEVRKAIVEVDTRDALGRFIKIVCPVCHSPDISRGDGFTCANGHVFFARQ